MNQVKFHQGLRCKVNSINSKSISRQIVIREYCSVRLKFMKLRKRKRRENGTTNITCILWRSRLHNYSNSNLIHPAVVEMYLLGHQVFNRLELKPAKKSFSGNNYTDKNLNETKLKLNRPLNGMFHPDILTLTRLELQD